MEEQTKEKLTKVLETISGRLELHDKNRAEIQSNISNACKELTQKILDAEEKAYSELENLYKSEDERLQKLLNEINIAIAPYHGTDRESSSMGVDNKDCFENLIARAKAELTIEQSYTFNTQTAVDNLDFTPIITFRTDINVSLRPPSNIHIKEKKTDTKLEEDKPAEHGAIVTFEGFNEAEFSALRSKDLTKYVKYRIALMSPSGEIAYEQVSNENVSGGLIQSIPVKLGEQLRACADYKVRVRGEYENGECIQTSKWTVSTDKIHIPSFEEICGWKACPKLVGTHVEYAVSGPLGRVATKVGEDSNYCTIIGNIALPLGKTTTWKIQVVNSRENKFGRCIYLGVAQYSIDQNDGSGNVYKGGWHLRCHDFSLYSAPPHKYLDKKYGPRRKGGEYLKNGEAIAISFDAVRGNLSFSIKDEKFGNAYEGIPLDKPLVPSSLLFYKNDSIKLLF